jgi:hypothetical protein
MTVDQNIVFAKDNIELNILSALLDGSAEMTLYLESDGKEVPFASIRREGPSYRYNNFNVRENGGTVIFCPVVVGCLTIFTVTVRPPASGGFRLEVIRKGEEAPAYGFTMGIGKNKFALSPIDMTRYEVCAETTEGGRDSPEASPVPPSPSSGSAPERRREELVRENASLQGGVALLEREIAELEARKASLAEKKQIMKKRLEWLSANVEGEESREVGELKETLGVDEAILACYEDAPGVEELLAEVRAGIEKLEDQIRIFVRRRQQKTLDVEKKLRGGK